LYLLLTLVLGWFLLPPLLLNASLPPRTEQERCELRSRLATPGSRWESFEVLGGEDVPLKVWRLHRPDPVGVMIFLHGFGDDAWGTLGRAADQPGWDAVGFTFRDRDRHPENPCTLGGWERRDVVAVVRRLEREGVPRSRMVLAAWSQGAGVALLALEDLEREGDPLGGALLECPFEDLSEASRNHVRSMLGRWEFLLRPAERLALARAGQIARFDPDRVSPGDAARRLRTPLALVTGAADRVTPLDGVRRIAGGHPDLTIVAGAGHCQASGRLPGGWLAWSRTRLMRWGFPGQPLAASSSSSRTALARASGSIGL
jgi:pimeloyl-ACP methyl ester carboxylesterase